MAYNPAGAYGEHEDTQIGKYLVFIIDSLTYAIDIKYVKEIIGVQTITAIPEAPEYIKGVINLRGKIFPVMDLRLRLGKESIDYNDRTCVIIMNCCGVDLALIVDTVSEIASIPKENISEPPSIARSHADTFVEAIGKIDDRVILIIDSDKLLKEDTITELTKIL